MTCGGYPIAYTWRWPFPRQNLPSKDGPIAAAPSYKREYLGANGQFGVCPELVEVIAPPLHGDTLLPIEAAIVDTANSVRVGLGERPHDCIRTPLAALVKEVEAVVHRPWAVT
jgi:hypothetical protein